MPDEPGVGNPYATNEAPSSPRDASQGIEGLVQPPGGPDTLIEIVIERDLAVQIVGSDAGKAKRMRPHGAMTKGSSPGEQADVKAIMEPFLNDEIRRVHEDRQHRVKSHLARATPSQALSLKAFCLRFTAFLRLHIENHSGSENIARSQQRRNQALRVISQIDAALGCSRTINQEMLEYRRDAIMKARVLDAALDALNAHAKPGIDPASTPLLELRGALRHCLDRCEQA